MDAANDPVYAPSGLQRAIEALNDTSPVTSTERAKHDRMIKQHLARERIRVAPRPGLFDGPEAA